MWRVSFLIALLLFIFGTYLYLENKRIKQDQKKFFQRDAAIEK